MLVVTNNPLMKEEDVELDFVDGSFDDVLVRVRDHVFNGYELISHPLFASLGMLFSPFRTVILGDLMDRPSVEYCEIAEEAVLKYRHVTEHRNRLPEYDEDYAWMDRSLYYSSLEEIPAVRQGL